MKKFIRKMALGTMAVLALGIGCAALDYAADAGNASDATKMSQVLPAWGLSSRDNSLRRDDVRWAQAELRYRGLYKGSLDGVLGPETKRAIARFQQNSGLGQTASLDAQTWEALTGNPGTAQGSSTPPTADRGAPSVTPAASDLGR